MRVSGLTLRQQVKALVLMTTLAKGSPILIIDDSTAVFLCRYIHAYLVVVYGYVGVPVGYYSFRIA